MFGASPPLKTDMAENDAGMPPERWIQIKWRYLFLFTERSHASLLAAGCAAAVIKGVAAPASALITGKIFGAITEYQAQTIDGDELVRTVDRYVTYLAGVAAALFALQSVFFACWVAFGEAQAKRAREQIFGYLLNQEISWFDRQDEGPDTLVARLNAQIRDLQLATSQPLGAVIGIVANACFSYGLAMYYSWKLTLVIMASIPVVAVFTAVTSRALPAHGGMQQKKKTEAMHILTTALNHIDTVKCYNAQQTELVKYVDKTKEVAHWFFKTINTNAQQQGFVAFVAAVLFVQAFYYGGTLVRSGEKNPGDIVTTFLSALAVYTSLNSINVQMLVLEIGRVAATNLRLAMHDSQNENQDARPVDLTNFRQVPPLSGQIDFTDVTFSYPSGPGNRALRRMNMMIPLGSTSFIVGQSGSGKSTIGQLLSGLYRPNEGTISIGGTDIQELGLSNLRKTLFLAEQDSMVFDDDILANLALGDTDAAVEEKQALDALAFALLKTAVLDMPGGLQTPLGPAGVQLSGGQRQRLALARAYIRDAPIMVLDESTSALDNTNRSLIMEAIRTWRSGKTTIFITHDLDLIKSSDYVYVIDGGKLSQEGYRKDITELATANMLTGSSCTTPLTPLTPASDRVISQGPAGRNANRKAIIMPNTKVFNPVVSPLPPEQTQAWSQFLPRFDRFSSLGLLNSPWLQQSTSTSASQSSRRLTRALNSTNWTNNPVVESALEDSARSSVLEKADPTDPAPDQVKAYVSGRRETTTEQTLMAFLLREGERATKSRKTKEERETAVAAASDLLDNEAPEALPVMSLHQVLLTVWPRLKLLQRLLLGLAVLLSGIHAAASPVTSLLTTKLIGTYSLGDTDEGRHQALKFALSIIGVAVVDGASQYVQQMLFEYIAQAWIDKARSEAVGKLLDQPKEFFLSEEATTAQLLESLDRHADQARNIVGRFVSLYLIVIVTILISTIWATVTNWKLALVTLAFLPAMFGLTKLFSKVASIWEHKTNDASVIINAIFIDTFTAIKTVKVLTAEDHFMDKVCKAAKAAQVIGKHRALWSGLFFGLSECFQTVAQAIVFLYGARLASQGVKVQDIILVLLMLIMGFTQASIILGTIPQASASRDSATRLFAITRLPDESHEHEGHITTLSIGDIDFRHVNFAYATQPEHKVLADLNFTIAPGTFTAIVGPSGSGKSTITNLLFRLYAHPPSATSDIFFSGRSINKFSTHAFRQRAALVPQDSPVVPGTIAENIGYGLTTLPDPAELVAAAEAVGLAEFIASLPAGYATLVGDGGQGLSGGQRQRLAIARALVRNPELLVLDEATSALDGINAERLIKKLQVLSSGADEGKATTVVAVTHDRRVMEGADRVVVLENGRVVEEGGFEELMERRGALARLMEGGAWLG